MRARNSIQISNLHSNAEGSRKHTFRIFVSKICYAIKHEFQMLVYWRRIPISISELMGEGEGGRVGCRHSNAIIHVNKTNDLIFNLTPENVTQHSRIE